MKTLTQAADSHTHLDDEQRKCILGSLGTYPLAVARNPLGPNQLQRLMDATLLHCDHVI